MMVTCLELYTKKTIFDKKHQNLIQIGFLFELIGEASRKFAMARSLCEKLRMICVHLKIHAFSAHEHHDFSQILNWYIENACFKLTNENTLLNYDTIIVMLYNCIKIMLGLEKIPLKTQNELKKLYSIF